MRRCCLISMLSLAMLVGCSSVTFLVHITDIEVSPRTLPPEGGEVRVIVKTINADYVGVKFVRKSDGATFSKTLSPEIWLGALTGQSKWDGKVRLPPNKDPEGKDQVYNVTVIAWANTGFDHVRGAGEVVVKGKSGNSDSTEPNPSEGLSTAEPHGSESSSSTKP